MIKTSYYITLFILIPHLSLSSLTCDLYGDIMPTEGVLRREGYLKCKMEVQSRLGGFGCDSN